MISMQTSGCHSAALPMWLEASCLTDITITALDLQGKVKQSLNLMLLSCSMFMWEHYKHIRFHTDRVGQQLSSAAKG